MNTKQLGRWRKLYCNPSPSWLALSYSARGLGYELLRLCDEAGRIECGRTPHFEMVALLAAIQPRDRKSARLDFAALVEDGFVRVEGSALTIPNFAEAQELKSPEAIRKERQRAREGASKVDASSSHDARMTHASSTYDAPIIGAQTELTARTDTSGTVTCHGDKRRGEESREEKKREETEVEKPAPVGPSPTSLALGAVKPQGSARAEKPRGCHAAPAIVSVAADPAGNQLALTAAPPAATARPSAVDRVFAHWQTTLGKERAKLDPKRRKCIEAALKSHGLETCLAAIDGCAASPFHQGENDRHTRYDDLTLILRDAKHIEEFADLAGETQPVAPQRPLHLVRPVVLKPEERFDPETARKAREELEALAATMRGRASGDYGG